MRVLALTNLYPNPFQPHRAAFNRQQFRILGERQPVHVVAPIAWTDEFQARRRGATRLPADRRVELDGLTVDHPRYWFPPKLARARYGHFYLWSVRRTVRAVLNSFRPDIVFAPWAYPDGWAAVRIARAAGLPAVVQVHGSDVLLLDRFPARARRTADALRSADGVVAVSRDLATRVEAFGVATDRIKVIYDGVNPDVFHPGSKAEARSALGVPDGDPVVLFIGNLLPVKAVDVLLEACGDLLKSQFPVRLVLVGQGPLRAQLERQADRLGLSDRVRFTGALPQTELPSWYRAADVFVLPSHSEGVPNVLLEASACGTPWVASRVGGIPEIAHLGISRMVPPAAPVELSRAIRDVLTAPPPAAPPPGPRSRHDAVAELEEWLKNVASRAVARAAPP